MRINKTTINRQPRPGNDVVVERYCQRLRELTYDYDWDGIVAMLEDDVDMLAAAYYMVLLAHAAIPQKVEKEIEYAKKYADPARLVELLAVTRDLQHRELREQRVNVEYDIGESVLTSSQALEV